MVKNILKVIAIFVVGMIGGIFADQIFWPYFIERPLFYQYRLDQRPIYVTEKKEIFIQENTALKNAVEKVEKSVIPVRTKTKEGIILEGSGLIFTSDGLLLTLAGLVPNGAAASFFVDNKPVSYQILKKNTAENLALIKISSANLPTTSLGQFNKIKLGERVFLVAVTIEKGALKKAVNEGIIKSFDEKIIQTNILEKYNFQGSPLFNIEGELVGLNTITAEGKVNAISIKKIREFVGL